MTNTCGKLESGSGSGDQDGGQHEDGIDIAAKKRRTRRGKPKHRKLKPYSKQSKQINKSTNQQQQLRLEQINQVIKRLPPAPFNTTQFIMDEHSLSTIEQKFLKVTSSKESKEETKKESKKDSLTMSQISKSQITKSRTRDSSFSVDSDEDYFYSSPEDEEEFLTKEFSTAYEDLHAERLNTLTKPELIQEYIQLEAKVDLLTKRLRGKNFHQIEERDLENKNVPTTDSDTAKKFKVYQQRIDDLLQQNEKLRRENEMLHTDKMLRADKILRETSSESSVDSESDSDSSSNQTKSCSCSFSSPGTPPKNAYKSILDNNLRTDNKSDSCNTSQSGSPRTSVTPTNHSNGHMTINEADSFPT